MNRIPSKPSVKRRGRPPLGKVKTTVRLDPDVIAKFKATGPGWQARMNDALKTAELNEGGTFEVTDAIIIAGFFAIYLLPMVVAMTRGHKNEMPIAIVNVFFGWTIIGWVGCLAWACSHQEARS